MSLSSIGVDKSPRVRRRVISGKGIRKADEEGEQRSSAGRQAGRQCRHAVVVTPPLFLGAPSPQQNRKASVINFDIINTLA